MSYVIYCSPVSNKIFIGRPSKRRVISVDRKYCTIDSLVEVSEHAVNFGKPVVITLEDGTPEFEITVKDLRVKNG